MLTVILQTVPGAQKVLLEVLLVRCWGRTWKRSKLTFRRYGCTIVCFLIKLLTLLKNSHPFHPLVLFFTPLTSGMELLAAHTADTMLGPCFGPQAGWSTGLLRCLLTISVLADTWRPAAERGLVRVTPNKDRGCFWLEEMSRQGFLPAPANQSNWTHRPVASPENTQPSFTLTQLSFPDVVWEKQVPDVTCLVIIPFPKDKAPCSSGTKGQADTYGGSSELRFAIGSCWSTLKGCASYPHLQEE